jgi:hypothetical protein
MVADNPLGFQRFQTFLLFARAINPSPNLHLTRPPFYVLRILKTSNMVFGPMLLHLKLSEFRKFEME